MQKMIIVSGDYTMWDCGDDFYGLEELNNYLADGWKVVNMQISSTTVRKDNQFDNYANAFNVCYVVIEKED